MVGKLALTTPKKTRKVSAVVSSLLAEMCPLVSTPSTVSSRLSTDFFSASLPSSLSAVSKSLSVLLTTSNIKKRLVLDNDNHRANTKMKHQEPKLAAYDVDWFDSSATKNKCIKHTSIKNLPDTQEGQLTFLLSKFKASEIKTAFADAIGKVGKAARKVFYPLPMRKAKLIRSFLELIYDGKSIMADNSKDSFR
jgi:hypothetical protein